MKMTSFLVLLLLALTLFVGCRHCCSEYECNIPDSYMENDALLPCPLCGNKPLVRRGFVGNHSFTPPADVEDGNWTYGVSCHTPGCLVRGTRVGFWHEKEAVDAWNENVKPWTKK